jgi:hypothetical protein
VRNKGEEEEAAEGAEEEEEGAGEAGEEEEGVTWLTEELRVGGIPCSAVGAELEPAGECRSGEAPAADGESVVDRRVEGEDVGEEEEAEEDDAPSGDGLAQGRSESRVCRVSSGRSPIAMANGVF